MLYVKQWSRVQYFNIMFVSISLTVKAGGMRIVQHKRPTDAKVSDPQLTAEELEQYGVR